MNSSGINSQAPQNLKLKIHATSNDSTIYRCERISYYLFFKGKCYEAFIIPNTECGVVKINVELFDLKKNIVISKLQKQVDFECGE